MYFSYPNLLFFSTLVSGTLLSVSSCSWFSAWVGLELNLLSFVPLMITKSNQYSSEAALKYFLIQSLGSSLIIFSASFMLIYFGVASIILFCALILKLGGAPFHFWFPQVMGGLLWPQAMILMSVQKVAPLFLLCYLASVSMMEVYFSVASMLSAVVGAVGGINQTSLRKVLAFSSINHIGWMLSSILVSEVTMGVYFLFYSVISLSIVVLFHYKQAFHFNHLLTYNFPAEVKMLVFFSLLSLGGLPPFTGFVPKWLVIQELVGAGNFVLLVVLLGSALVTLYFYLRVSIMSLTISTPSLVISFVDQQGFKWVMPCCMFVNFFGLLIPFVIMIV
uniref:NADH-ubiquinone oxidoreductase chain 2 n=1 Tax=Coenobita brevimanus TaxID=1547439 RepID=A0A3S6IYW9_9EUCA|nr:NADH dehydrogenase subunit 2 [Coenobita brevimanus]QUL61626.1 NADH dehydrogenase subunit 2 [Coenobita brevimanus]